MPILHTSGNLNLLGNAGNYETDPSTWGYGLTYAISRFNGQQTLGTYSCKLTNTGGASFDTNPFFGATYQISFLGRAKFVANPGKKYIITVNVFTPSANQLAPDHCPVGLRIEDLFDFTTIYQSAVLISACKDNWQTVTFQIETVTGGFIPVTPGQQINLSLFIAQVPFAGDTIASGGIFNIDQFEIYEYIDVASTLAFDLPSCSVTDDTGSSDGTITIAATGGTTPYQYSKDGGSTWQSSNVFSGLAAGTYHVQVKDDVPYTISHDFIVNLSTVPFAFTTVVTNETIATANNGKIVVNVTGSSGPYQYSKDGGITYQSSNTFLNLAPGTYNVYVKDASDNTLGHVVTILAGTILFEKVWFSRNPIIYQAAASSDWEMLTNVRLYNEVKMDDNTDGNYVSKINVALPPDSNGNVVFYNRRAIEKTLTAIPPIVNSQSILKLTDRIKYFKNYTAQLDGINVIPSSTTPSLPHLVLLGGLSKLQWPTADFFLSYLPTKKKFMTWAPVIKQVDKFQEDYLNFFIHTASIVQLKRKLKVYYDDATNQTVVTSLVTGCVYGQLYQVPAGPTNGGANDIAATAGKNMLSYEFSLLNQDDIVISETRTFILDPVSHPRKRLFMFLNSLGSYEVLRFTGVAEKQVVITKNEIVKFLPYNYSALDGERAMNDVSMRESDNFSTGYFTDQFGKEWLDYMKDLVLSRQVFDVTDGRRIPIMVKPATYPTGADQNYEYYLRFSADDAYLDESYTPKVLP